MKINHETKICFIKINYLAYCCKMAAKCYNFLDTNFTTRPSVPCPGIKIVGYTQSLIRRTGRIRTGAEFLGKFKNQALGSSNLRTTSKNLRTTTAQIFKAKNRVLLPFLIHIFHLHIHKFKFFFISLFLFLLTVFP